MKTKMMIITSVALICLAFVMVIAGCSSVRQLEASEFMEHAREIKELHSIKSTRLIGVCGERVYLEHWQAPLFFGSDLTVYWTCINDLPESIASDLKMGKNPWEESEMK